MNTTQTFGVRRKCVSWHLEVNDHMSLTSDVLMTFLFDVGKRTTFSS